MVGVLTEAGDLAAAEQACAAALASCRDVGDLANLCGVLWHQTILDLRTGRIHDAPAHLRELFQIATQTGLRPLLPAGLDCCGHLCAATGRPAEAITVWAAMSALASPWPMHGGLNPERREELRRQAREQLGPARTRAAEERGAAMSLATATEYAVLLASEPVRPSGNGASAAGDGASPSGNGASAAGDGASLLGDCGSRSELTADGGSWRGSVLANANWSRWSRGATPTRRSRASCTSRCARSARTWTGSGTRPAAAAGPTSLAWPSAPAWSSPDVGDSTPAGERVGGRD